MPYAFLLLAGCTVVSDMETYDAVATGKYSVPLDDAVAVSTYEFDCRWPCYRVGASLISIFPSARGSNVIAMGPLLPVVPAPGSGDDFGEFDFFLAVHVHPGEVSLVMFRPGDFKIRPQGGETAIPPHRVSDCYDGKTSPDLVRVYGQVRCFKIEFPVARSELERFLLVPPLIESDGMSYALPDIQWSPGTYRTVQ